MSASRETILNALLTLAGTVTGISAANTSRRNRAPEDITPAQCPALFVLESGDEYERPSPSLPPKRHLMVSLAIYNDVGAANLNLIPTAAINNALDALDAALKPTDPSGLFTLGGLVSYVVIEGEARRSPGDRTGKAVAIVPLRVMLP